MKTDNGFTLIELLVVIAIIGLMAAVIMVSLNTTRAKARDVKRKADLVQVQKALELYYDHYNAYPSTLRSLTMGESGRVLSSHGTGCGNSGSSQGYCYGNSSPSPTASPTPTPSVTPTPSPSPATQPNSGSENPPFLGYSVLGGRKELSGPDGYIPNLAPKFISMLPMDPSRRTEGWSGYLYASDGASYKLLINDTPESYPIVGEPFYDPIRPGSAWMICSGQSACDNW